jgi:hypothetical protein
MMRQPNSPRFSPRPITHDRHVGMALITLLCILAMLTENVCSL